MASSAGRLYRVGVLPEQREQRAGGGAELTPALVWI